MIKFEKCRELDLTMKNLMSSMVQVHDYLTEVLNYSAKVLTAENEKELMKILKKYNVPLDSLKYNLEDLTENPYFRDIKLDRTVSDTVKHDNIIIKKRTLMSMDFHQPLGKYLFHFHPIGYFETDIEMPVLIEDEKVWMSPAISEIKSMEDGIAKGHGKCLTLGLGIGVLPYLWLLNDEVESVTVVEFNRDVIDLFEKHIRPQFKTDKRLQIIHGDAFDYYNESFLNQFDYVYADFWESSEDGLELYTRLMKKKLDLPHIDYWIEDSILCDVKHAITPYLYNLYEGNSVANFISSVDGNLKELLKKTNRYFKTRNDVISREDELLHIIHSKDVLRKILAQ